MTRKTTISAIVAASFLVGLYLNALGWLGNAILLQEDWNGVHETIGVRPAPPYSPITRELVTLLSDFVYAFALVWIYSTAGPDRRAPWRFALELVVMLWLTTVAMTYLTLVNSGFLPPGIALKSGLWALATFLPVAAFLPLVFRSRNGFLER